MPIYTISSIPRFCTYLTTYLGSKLPMFYIGSGTISNIEHPTKPYRGSVSSKAYKSIWLQELEDNPHLFKTTILRRFHSRKNATFHELKLQKFLRVVPSEMYINMGYAQKNFADETKRAPLTKETKLKLSIANTGKNKGMKRGPQTEEHRHNTSIALTGKKRTEEFKRNQSVRMTGKKISDETKLKRSEALTGKKRTEEQKQAQSVRLSGKKRGPYKKRAKLTEVATSSF